MADQTPRHLALPLQRTAAGPLAALEQDSDAEIAQSVGLLLATRVGDRRSASGYGLPDPLGRGLDPESVSQALRDWEPRADPATVLTSATAADGSATAAVYLT